MKTYDNRIQVSTHPTQFMDVEFALFGPMRDAAGQKTIIRQMEPGTTVRDALQALAEEFPPFYDHFFDDDQVVGQLVVTVNERNIKQRNGLQTELDDGDVVRIAPPVVGGNETVDSS